MELYKEKLMNHYHNPHNYGYLENPDFTTQEINPSCGDSITIEGHIEGTILKDLRFRGSGCIISQATGSLLTQFCIGKSIKEVMNFNQQTVIHLLAIPIGSLRIQCIVLALQALQEGIKQRSMAENDNARPT